LADSINNTLEGSKPKTARTKNEKQPSENTFLTLNNQGYMLSDLHAISEAFLNFADQASGPVLDIGAAYGFVVLQALKTKAYIIANDIEPQHLEAIKGNVPEKEFGRISFVPGRIPGEVEFEENSLGAVLASGVLHYLPPLDFVLAIQDIARWLKPEGRFFFATPSPYTNLYKKFSLIFKKNKETGKEWPGYIDDTSKVLPRFFNTSPQSIHLMDDDLVKSILEKNGLEIEQIKFFNIPLPTTQFKEETNILGVIARKPQPDTRT
jgi:SAM-dependent methyltransferase